jgi:hypothetical protein
MSASLSSNHHHNHNHGGRDNLNGMFDDYLSKPQPGAIIVYIRHVRLRSRPINGAVEAFSPEHFNVRDPAIYQRRDSAYAERRPQGRG